MDFALTEDQRAIEESARAFVADIADAAARRAVVAGASGYHAELWDGLAGRLGYAGLMIPQSHGGSGLGAVEMALVLEETGRVLAAVPFFETAVLAVQAVLAAGSQAQRAEFLPKLASGACRASFAGTAGRPRLQAGRLRGVADYVTFAHVADLLVVATADDSLIALPVPGPGITIEPLATLDRTRRFARVTFDGTVPEGAILGEPGGVAAAIRRVLAVGGGLLAAEQTGGAQYCLDSTVEYARQRVQFGRPIGSFQAYKHALADMMVRIEASRSAYLYAACAIDADDGELEEACHIARLWASDGYNHCAGEAIQLHGGIGFTWDHPAHLYFKRARATSSWFGSPDAHREALARILLREDA